MAGKKPIPRPKPPKKDRCLPKRELNEDGICKHWFDETGFSDKDYQKAENKFLFMTGYFRSFLSCNPGYLEDCSEGSVPVPKWAFKIVAEAFERHYEMKEVEHNLDATLDDAFGISGECKQETMRKLYARNKDIFFRWLNRIRMYFGLNIKDAATTTWKIVYWYEENHPGMFYKFNASPESMLDAYYRAYPQHEFIQWVVKESQTGKGESKRGAEYWMDWLEKKVPEAATYIKRKIRVKSATT